MDAYLLVCLFKWQSPLATDTLPPTNAKVAGERVKFQKAQNLIAQGMTLMDADDN